MPNDSHATRWFILLLLVAAIALGVHGCHDRAAGGFPVDTLDQPRDAVRSPRIDAPSSNVGTDAAMPDEARKSFRAANNVLHAYIGALPGAERAKADAFWRGGKFPAGSNEADLRSLPSAPNAMRLEILPPASPPTNQVQLPISLRLSMQGGTIRRYTGWYRLERTPGTNDWAITAASIDALPVQE